MDSFELSAYKRGYRVIAGVDEAGRGPLAGPVVAAAVVLPPGFRLDGVRDSKQLTEKKRQRFYDIIQNGALSWALGVVEPSVIDRINIFQATRLAMKEAVQQISAGCGLSPHRRRAGPAPQSPHHAGNDHPGRHPEHLRGLRLDHRQGVPGPDHGDLPSPVSPVQLHQQQGLRHEGTPRVDTMPRPLQDPSPELQGGEGDP